MMIKDYLNKLIIGSIILCAGALFYAGCEVTNPGPVQDQFLNEPGAFGAVAEGANFSVSQALWQVSYMGEESIKNVTRAGRNFCCPKVPPRIGDFRREVGGDISTVWNTTQRARWVAEDGYRRFVNELGEAEAKNLEEAAKIKLSAGYANRILGENVCEAVIDGGEIMPYTEYFERAEGAFSTAIEIGNNVGRSDIVTAAYAGRASVRATGLNNWQDALQDADQVDEDFSWEAIYTSLESAQFNHMYELGSGNPWVDWTILDTFFENYYDDTGDPRASWEDTGREDTPLGLTLLQQQKYTSRSDNVNLSSGREMILLRAENALRNENLADAMTYINQLRTSVTSDATGEALEEKTADTIEEGWTALKEERRVELWLEGRYMWDLRRWIADNTPGEQEDMSERIRLCIPIPNSEADSNPNFGRDHQDPVNPTYTGG